MNTKIVFSAAALSVLCCLYLASLTNAAESASENNPTGSTVQSTALIPASENILPDPVEHTTLKTKRTVRKIFNDSAQTVECKSGTKLFFPRGSFVYPSGKRVEGEVKLVVEECYDIDEMLAAKLSTTSGDRRLETAGMIQLRAFAGNTELKLAEDSRYNIYFPVEGGRKEDFELFYGRRNESGIIDWKMEENSNPINESAKISEPIVNDCFLQISASQFRCGTRIQEMDYFNWPLVNGQNLNQWFVSSFNPDPSMLDDFCAQRMYSQITFHLNEDGTFKDYYISHSSREQYDRLLAGTLQSMPPLDIEKFMPRFTEDHACVLSFGRLVDFVVETPSGENTSVSMIFDKDRSIVSGIKQGNLFIFNNVPANRNVRVITLDNPNGNPRMEETILNTANRKCVVRNMEQITLADLDRALCWN